jgi:16S rRNA G966 N2-methylase RsmD
MTTKFKTVSTHDLIPYARNSRTHSETQVAKIAASIREFGFLNPVIVDGKNGIIAGHGRVMAAQKLGLAEVPVIEAAHLTDAQKRAYVIADNRLALDAGWDDAMLKIELQDLDLEGFDLTLTGFDLGELTDLLAEPVEGLTDEDDVPEVPAIPLTVEGDVWLLGRHRLMCGDSTSTDAVGVLLNGDDWDVCFFDPPYEQEKLYADAMPIAAPNKKLLIMWDFKRFALAPHSALIAGWTPQYELIWDCIQSWFTPNRPLQRHKSLGVFADDPFFDTGKALIQDGKDRGKPRIVSNTRGLSHYSPLDGAKHISTVEAFSNVAQTDEHGHGEPFAWLEAIFNGVGGRVYLDLFGGSGTTLIVCEKTARDCRMMELDPKYCDVIIKRWQEFTGQPATLEATGQTFAEMGARRD